MEALPGSGGTLLQVKWLMAAMGGKLPLVIIRSSSTVTAMDPLNGFEPQALSDREKAVLRLLAQGHDAKSSARQLGISLNAVNERLRAARRKLEVSSSREAARRLASSELQGSNSFVDKKMGVAVSECAGEAQSHQSKGSAR